MLCIFYTGGYKTVKLEIVFKDGRKVTFDDIESYNVTEEQTENEERNTFDVAKIPTDGKLFEVNPIVIDRMLFEKKKKNKQQEQARQIILEAFVELDTYPEKYASPFYTLIPEMNKNRERTVTEFRNYANDLGGNMADWVEQAFEWAQRISNGESWKTICNDADTAKWFRIIIWKNGCARVVGGSSLVHFKPASFVSETAVNWGIANTVTLIIIRK